MTQKRKGTRSKQISTALKRLKCEYALQYLLFALVFEPLNCCNVLLFYGEPDDNFPFLVFFDVYVL